MRKIRKHVRIPPPTLTLHPFQDERHWIVILRKTPAQVRRLMKVCGFNPHPRQLGCCIAMTARDLPDCFGVIFAADTCSVVMHELAHAAFRSCESIGVHIKHCGRQAARRYGQVSNSEELYCLVFEGLCTEFLARYYEQIGRVDVKG